VQLTSDLENDPSLSTHTSSISNPSSSSTSISPPALPLDEIAHPNPNLAVALTSSSIVGSTTSVVDGKSATATAMGIAERANDPADKIERAVALIPEALDDNGIDVVGAAFTPDWGV
jgi:hypothetical protein